MYVILHWGLLFQKLLFFCFLTDLYNVEVSAAKHDLFPLPLNLGTSLILHHQIHLFINPWFMVLGCLLGLLFVVWISNCIDAHFGTISFAKSSLWTRSILNINFRLLPAGYLYCSWRARSQFDLSAPFIIKHALYYHVWALVVTSWS